MSNLRCIELKPFVPAKDYELSKRFYQDVGFSVGSSDANLTYFHYESVSFLLQNFYVKELADNFMLHLLVEDVDAWRTKIESAGVAGRFGVSVSLVRQQPWRMRDFVMIDPSGVQWRVAQNVAEAS